MTSVPVVRQMVERVASNAAKWHALPASKKLEYLLKIQNASQDVFYHWGFRSLQVRNWDSPDHTHLVGNAMLISSGMLGMHLDAAIGNYHVMANTGAPPKCQYYEKNGQRCLRVFPFSLLDNLLWPLYTVDIYIQPGKPATQGEEYRHSKPGVAAILGAGNYEAPVDILTKMFVENKTVIYKSHPNTGPATDKVYAYLFRSLIEDGFLQLCSGGIDVGDAMLNHENVDESLMTGGCMAYDCIMWGSPAEQAANKKAGNKKYKKKFEAELGAVSPWMVVPGKWPKIFMKHQVEWLVASKAFNGGALCASPQVVIVDKKWPQYQEFISEIREKLEKSEPTPHWYPGAGDKLKIFAAASPSSELLPTNSKWQTVFIPDCPKDSFVIKDEAFAPVLAVVALDCGGDPDKFLAEATKYANDDVMGSLSMTMAIDPLTAYRHRPSLDKAIADLKWGTVGINEWGGAGLFFGSLCWGAYHGRHKPEDIQSGEGFIGNHRMVDFPQKSVMRGTWFSLNHGRVPDQAACTLYERMAYCASKPHLGRAIGVGAAIAGIY